jgi:hypothetical protein
MQDAIIDIGLQMHLLLFVPELKQEVPSNAVSVVQIKETTKFNKRGET